jgi:hypothetical protein
VTDGSNVIVEGYGRESGYRGTKALGYLTRAGGPYWVACVKGRRSPLLSFSEAKAAARLMDQDKKVGYKPADSLRSLNLAATIAEEMSLDGSAPVRSRGRDPRSLARRLIPLPRG